VEHDAKILEPLLAGILLRAAGGKLELAATDMELSLPRDELARALGIVSRGVSTRTTVQIRATSENPGQPMRVHPRSGLQLQLRDRGADDLMPSSSCA
jgi:hypothetical protein